jgi:D-alanyl-D-alanine carboxypeptidase
MISQLFNTAQATATANNEKNKDAWPSGPSVNAESAIVMEASTGLILYEKNINEEHYPASITKIMTVLLALENSSLGDIVTFSNNAVYDVEADSSRLWIGVGEQLTMEQCLYGILLESANDIAYAVAEHVSGNIDNFAKLMNERAKSIGCKNTNFVNPHGLPDDNHYTSAYDMALITREAMKNPTFRKIFGTRTYQIPPTNLQSETRYLVNHHKFIKRDTYLYDDCIGGKTGFTSKSKYTLVSVAKRGDLELICVIMKDATSANQYTDTKKLFDFAFDNFSIYPIADVASSQALTESPMFTRYNSLLSQTETPIVTDKDGYLVLPNTASFEDAEREVSFFPPSDKASQGTSPESVGNTASDASANENVIGKISYTYDGKYVGGADILYKDTNAPSLIKAATGEKNPTAIPEASSARSGKSLRPIIIGGIVAIFIIAIGLYYAFVERPRLRRRNAYYRKRALRRMFKDDDFLDL